MHRPLFQVPLVVLLSLAGVSQVNAGPKEALQHQLEKEISEFCRTVHTSAPVIRPQFVEASSEAGSEHPDLTFKYKNIQCEGVETPALKLCGFCGLTMNGMECLVKTFTFRDGKYVETESHLEPIIQ